MPHPYPNFLIVGMMKAGTTTIYDQIASHPLVVKAREKETHYFTPEYVQVENTSLFQFEYHEVLNYDASQTDRLYGEATPAYIVVPERIMAFNPNCKVIILIRDPSKCALSQYRQYKEYGIERMNFTEAFENLNIENRYVRDNTFYSRVERFGSVYPKDNILVVSFEKYLESPQEAMNAIFAFLGAPTIQIDATREASRTRASIDESPEVLDRIRNYFGRQQGKLYGVLKDLELKTWPLDRTYFLRY